MTEKIYEKQSFINEYRTEVSDCIIEDGKVYIKLKESIFFPEEGGQYSDTGYITCNGKTVNVLKGEILGSPTEGETDIRYLVDDRIEPGTEVLCKLDWDIRFDRMQNHSGEHIISGLVHNMFGYNNVGFHLSDDEPVTLAFDGILTQDQIDEIERDANRIIYMNLAISDSYPSKEELVNITFRSKIDIKAQVRLITIGDEKNLVDICACCAPHVKQTGQIGIIKIISSMKFKGGTQLSILCGRRALEYITKNIDNLNRIAKGFSTHPDNVAAIVSNLKEENMALNARVSELTESMIIDKINKNEYDRLVFADMDLSAANMKNIYNALTDSREGYVAVLTGSDDKGYRFYAGGKDLDAKKLSEMMRQNLNSKGGGSSEMIQGRIECEREKIINFWETMS